MLSQLNRNGCSLGGFSCLDWLQQWGRDESRSALITIGASGGCCELTWPSLTTNVLNMVNHITRQGFVPGDRLVHCSGNSELGVVIALASLIAGTIEVPLDPSISQPHQAMLSTYVGGRWLEPNASDLNATFSLDYFAAKERDFAPGQPTLILFTSGTTGESRGVTLSRENLFHNAYAKLQAVPQHRDDLRITVLPLCHAYARTCDLMTWLLSGCTLAVTAGWEGWQQLTPELRPTLVNVVPSLADRLVSQAIGDHSTSRLRLLGCGGAAMSPALFDGFQNVGITVIQGYGLTEASPVVCSATPANAKPGYVGCPVVGCQTRIADDGRLAIRGPGVMLGYWNDPVATEQAIAGRWLDTGDCVEVDGCDGQFRVLGRFDDRITLANGRSFFPAPIEQRIAGTPGVHHAIIIGRDRHVELFIDVDPSVSQPQADWDAIISAELADLPSWQRPRSICRLPFAVAEQSHWLTQKGTLRRNVVTAELMSARLPMLTY